MSFLALFNKSAQPLRYKLLARLTAYNGSIHALAISNDGHLLACGGTEGIKIWDIKSRKELTSSSNHHESRGTVSCAIWATTTKTAAETLCYGTGLGYIVCLQRSLTDEKFQEICARRLGSGFEITCLSWHSTSSEGNLRIVVGTRDKMVQVLMLNTSSQLQPVFTVRLENTVPKSIMQQTALHYIALKVMCIGPKQVAFGEEGKVVVGGSDHGLVYIFDRKTGETLETLHHGHGLVQTISISTQSQWPLHNCQHFTCARAQETTIKIWAYDYAVPKVSKAPSGDYWSLSHILVMLTRLLALLSMSVFLLINYRDSFLRVQAAMIFDEYVDIQKDKEGPTEGYVKNDIVMLRELAAKILELAQEADGEIDKDDHRGKRDTDYPQAVKGDEEAKDLSPIDLSPVQYM
ncbi:WD40-repeat-containing domain protein [Suillus spraguei]|nr:WD40-repeat-containing domain protein [Suillus spraguei]